MTHQEFNEFFERFVEAQTSILVKKGPEYAAGAGASADRLGNFLRTAAATGGSPLQVWLTFFLKHVDSVCTYVRTGIASEPIEGRLLDIANYAALGAALVKDLEKEKNE